MPMYQAFKCTACGAQNAAGPEASCGFCVSAAPASALSKEVRTHRRSLFVDPAPSYQAAPPPPVDEGIAVDGTGVVCRSCGRYAAIPGKRMPGNLALEVLLWFFYLIPGVIYTMWRRQDSNAVRYCTECDSQDLLPIFSPEGQLVFSRKYGRKPLLR